MSQDVRIEVKFVFKPLSKDISVLEQSIIDLLIETILYHGDILLQNIENKQYKLDMIKLHSALQFIEIETRIPLIKPNRENISTEVVLIREENNSFSCQCKIDDIYVLIGALMESLPTIATKVLSTDTDEIMISPRLIFPDIQVVSISFKSLPGIQANVGDDNIRKKNIDGNEFVQIAIDEVFPTLAVSRKAIFSIIQECIPKLRSDDRMKQSLYDELNIGPSEGMSYSTLHAQVCKKLNQENILFDIASYFDDFTVNNEIHDKAFDLIKENNKERSQYIKVEQGHITLGLHPRLEIANIHALYPKSSHEEIEKFLILRVITSDLFFRLLSYHTEYNELLAGIRSILILKRLYRAQKLPSNIEEEDLVDYFYDFVFFDDLYAQRDVLFSLISTDTISDIEKTEEALLTGLEININEQIPTRKNYPMALNHRIMGLYHVKHNGKERILPIEEIFRIYLSNQHIEEVSVFDRDLYYNYYLDKQDLNLLPDFIYSDEKIPLHFPLYFKPFQMERYLSMELENPIYSFLKDQSADPLPLKNLVLTIKPKNPDISSKSYTIFYYFMRRLFEDHHGKITNVMTSTGSYADYFLDKITSRIEYSEIRMYVNKNQLDTSAPEELYIDEKKYNIPSKLHIQFYDTAGVYLFLNLVGYLNRIYGMFTKDIITRINSCNFEYSASLKEIEELFNIIRYLFSAEFNLIGFDRITGHKTNLPVNLTISRTKFFVNIQESFFLNTRLISKYIDYHIFIQHYNKVQSAITLYKDKILNIIQEEEERSVVSIYFNKILEILEEKHNYTKDIHQKIQNGVSHGGGK